MKEKSYQQLLIKSIIATNIYVKLHPTSSFMTVNQKGKLCARKNQTQIDHEKKWQIIALRYQKYWKIKTNCLNFLRETLLQTNFMTTNQMLSAVIKKYKDNVVHSFSKVFRYTKQAENEN